MRRHLTNAASGVLDYASYPVGMLMVAPIVLHRIGASEYGLWMISTALISAGGIVASGFGDANIQRVAHLRATGQIESILRTFRSMLGINVVLGLILAVCAWIAAPYAAPHIAVAHQTSAAECLISLRIASALILLRSIETVAVSTHRAFEQYRGTVLISTATRLLTLASAAILAFTRHGTISILLATAAFLALGTFLQFRQLRGLLGTVPMWPLFHSTETQVLLGLGVFVWLQAVGAVIFGQFDRLFLGVSLGALVVAPYSLCAQFAQPIFGLTASGLNFLFPYLSGRASSISGHHLRRTILKAFACNLFLVACGAGILLLIEDRLIQLWAGPVVAQSASRILVPITLSSALMGLSVTGTYAMQALGRFRTVTFISLGSRTAMLLVMIQLVHHMGLQGLALARLYYGAAALLVYVPLIGQLNSRKQGSPLVPPLPVSLRVREEAKL